jgi:hypothetical protein
MITNHHSPAVPIVSGVGENEDDSSLPGLQKKPDVTEAQSRLWRNRPELRNDGVARVFFVLLKDQNGFFVIQEDMMWGDSPTAKKRTVLEKVIALYVRKYNPDETDEEKIKGMVKSCWMNLRELHTKILCAARSWIKSTLFAHAYKLYGICYIENGKVVPATSLENLKSSWKQDWSDENTEKMTKLWDHHLQKQQFWATSLTCDIMRSCGIVYDDSYTTFRDTNTSKNLKTLKPGPKFIDGCQECGKFSWKKMRDGFRMSNNKVRNFIMPAKTGKGKKGEELEEAVTKFLEHNPILTVDKDEMASLKRVLKIKSLHFPKNTDSLSWKEKFEALQKQMACEPSKLERYVLKKPTSVILILF